MSEHEKKYFMKHGFSEERAYLLSAVVDDVRDGILAEVKKARDHCPATVISNFGFNTMSVDKKDYSEAWFLYDEMHNPFPWENNDVSDAELVKLQARMAVLSYYGFVLMPMSPYSVIEPLLAEEYVLETEDPNTCVVFAPAPVSKEVFLVRKTQRYEDRLVLTEQLVYAAGEGALRYAVGLKR